MHYRIFKTIDKDFDGAFLAKERKGAPLYGLFQVFDLEDGGGRGSDPIAIFDTIFEDDKDPVKYFNKLLTEAQQALTMPIVNDLWETDENGCYTLANGECVGNDCIHTRGVK